MKQLKNLAVGFGVSFIGSVPLGYLNVIGFEIYSDHGFTRLLPYLLGVVCEEAIVVYLTLLFVHRLSSNSAWVKAFELLSFFFLIGLAAYFFFRGQDQQIAKPAYLHYPPFIAGAVLNAINFMQLPFWTGWNLYLVNAGHLAPGRRYTFAYLAGALTGTLAGMLSFILLLHSVAESVDGLSSYLMKYLIPAIFLAMAVFQLVKLWRNRGGDRKR